MGGKKKNDSNVLGRWAKSGRFASKKDIEEQQQHDRAAAAAAAALAATADLAEDEDGREAEVPPLPIVLCERPVNVRLVL